MNIFRKAFLTLGAIVAMSGAVKAQTSSYQDRADSALEQVVKDDYASSYTKGPTSVIIDDTTYDIAGAAQSKDGSKIVAVDWLGQKKPNETGPYVFLTYDTTQMSQDQFYDKLYNDLKDQLSPTGVDDIVEHTTKLYPNPTRGKFTFVINKETGNYVANVYDLSGRLLQSKKGSFNESSGINLNILGYSNGLYLVAVKTDKDGKVYVRKVDKR